MQSVPSGEKSQSTLHLPEKNFRISKAAIVQSVEPMKGSIDDGRLSLHAQRFARLGINRRYHI